MTFDIFLFQLLNGLVSSMLLFIMAAGLSLIFGQMDVVNLMHGSFYLLGGYLGLLTVRLSANFWLALLVAPLLVAALGLALEWGFLRRLYGRHRHLNQVLFTFGISLIAADLMRWQWGTYVETISPPDILSGKIPFFGFQFPVYRLALIGFGLLLALGMWLLLERTQLGAIVRAGVTDVQMVSALGINIHWIFAGVFAVGAGLAALAGVLGAPILNLHTGLDSEILILAMVVVVIGGLGSLQGAFWGSLLIGMVDTFGKALLPEFALFFIFMMMAVVLLFRPSGLVGIKVT
jgi:branched-chain amino acid transport system permease protein